MPAVRKFLFDQSFDVEETRKKADIIEEVVKEAEPVIIEPVFKEDALDIAYDVGFDAGKEEGVREKSDAIENDMASALNKILEGLPELFTNQQKNLATARDDAMATAIAISRKILPGLGERNSLGEIERMVEMALEKVIDDSQVVVRVNDQLYDAMDERIQSLAKAGNFAGKLLLQADAGLSAGDCRIEWDSGGANRDMKAIWQEIDSVIERNFKGEIDCNVAKGADVGDLLETVEATDDEIASQEVANGLADSAPSEDVADE